MKRFMNRSLIVLGLLLAVAISGFAQTAPTFSTLGAAQTVSAVKLTLASTTGFTASTTAPNSPRYVLVDGELEKVTAIDSATVLSVVRHQGVTKATPHASGVYAVYGTMNSVSWDPSATGSPTYGTFLQPGTFPTGACTLASQQYSPVFTTAINTGDATVRAYSCSGSWSFGNWPAPVDVTAIRACTIPIGGAGTIVSDLTAYGTDATRVDGTIYVGSIDVPTTRVVNLLSSLTGTTAPTTDKQVFGLYNSTGSLVGSTALAGVAAATADIFFDQNLTTPLIITPGRYFFALQMYGATTTIQMVATADGRNSLVGNSRTGTHGVLPSITVPTTLTTSTAPIGCLG